MPVVHGINRQARGLPLAQNDRQRAGMPRIASLVAALLLMLSTGVGTSQAARAWTWPLTPEPAVTRPFGLGPTVYAAGHRGADLAGEAGQVVLAAGAGRVTYAGRLAGRGVVTVTHGTLRTTYEPVTATVRVGAVVERAEQVGTLEPGHDGCPAAACLHWGLRRGDTYLDPLRLVQQGPVRLLTLGGRESPTGAAAGARETAQIRADPTGRGRVDVDGTDPGTQPADHDPDAVLVPVASVSSASSGPSGRWLAGGLTSGAAVLLVAGSGAAVRRRAEGNRSSGVGR